MTATTSTLSPLLVERDARGVVTFTLADPGAFNALSDGMLGALEAATAELARDDGVRVLVIAAQGKAFSAGHNLKEMVAAPTLADHQALFNRCGRWMMSLTALPVPVIAKVQGIATAAGCQLVAQCDLAVAVDTARFAVSGIHYGLFCATPSVPLVRNVGAKQAMEMLLTGDFISAAQAREQGLVNHVVPAAELDADVERLVQSILDKPATAVRMGKALFYQQREMGMGAAYQLAAQTMAVNMMDADAKEGILAFTEKRQPTWRSGH